MADPAHEAALAELQEVGVELDLAMGGLSDDLQSHLRTDYDAAEAPSSPAGADDLATFAATRHGEILSRGWAGDTARNLGVALARMKRIEKDMSADDLSEWRDFFHNSLTPRDKAVLVAYLAAQE